MRMTADDFRQIRAIFHKEWLEIIRNKKIIIFSFLLPILIYPIVFFGLTTLEKMQDKKLFKTGFVVGFLEDKAAFKDILSSKPDIFLPVNVSSLAEARRKKCSFVVDVYETRQGRLLISYFFDGSDDASMKAMKAFQDVFEEHKDSFFKRYLKNSGYPLDIPSEIKVSPTDIGSSSARSGHLLAKILPFFLVIMLISGCSATSVDLIAGEKERGCFETLLVSPVDRHNVIFGKFLIVFSMGLASVLLNLAGLLMTLRLGLISLPESVDFEFHLTGYQIFYIILCTLPLAVLLTSIVLYFSARARSFQEGQLMLFPFTLLVMVPTVTGIMPGIHSKSIILLVPVANIVVCMKEMLEGAGNLFPFIAANIINLGYAAGVVALSVRLLKREGAFVSGRTPVTLAVSGPDPVKGGLLTFSLTWLVFYYVASVLQSRSLVWGLLFTLWVMLPVLAFMHLKWMALPIKPTLRLRHPRWTAYPSALVMAVGMYYFVIFLNTLLQNFLPIPERVAKGFYDVFFSNDMNTIQVAFLLCLSPAINEELMFRGALMGGFLRRLKPVWAVILTGILFGFLHFNIYRLFPTMLLGIGFGYIVYITGSIFPGMLAHFMNNFMALVISPAIGTDDIDPLWYGFALPIVVLGSWMLWKTSQGRQINDFWDWEERE